MIVHLEGSLNGGIQTSWFIMENVHLEMDEVWGYPHFRKPVSFWGDFHRIHLR